MASPHEVVASLRRVCGRSIPSPPSVQRGAFHRRAWSDLLPDLLSRSTILNDSDHARAVHAHLNRSMAFHGVTREPPRQVVGTRSGLPGIASTIFIVVSLIVALAFFGAKQIVPHFPADNGWLIVERRDNLGRACEPQFYHSMPVDADWKGHFAPPED